jgi:membrane protein involved in colicin uptake
MTNPIITIHDIETDKIITREMNAKELAQYKADSIASNKIKTEAEAKATARAEILDRLGITAEEALILLG